MDIKNPAPTIYLENRLITRAEDFDLIIRDIDRLKELVLLAKQEYNEKGFSISASVQGGSQLCIIPYLVEPEHEKT